MNKSDRMENLVEILTGHSDAEACYSAYFLCFNRAQYYEAHDVLEHAWLKLPKKEGAFLKGLIQLAGAFVHLQKQYLRPHHYKFAGRLKPAARLLWLVSKNLQPYAPTHLQLRVTSVLECCESFENKIVTSEYQLNPWRPQSAPTFQNCKGVWSLSF